MNKDLKNDNYPLPESRIYSSLNELNIKESGIYQFGIQNGSTTIYSVDSSNSPCTFSLTIACLSSTTISVS